MKKQMIVLLAACAALLAACAGLAASDLAPETEAQAAVKY